MVRILVVALFAAAASLSSAGAADSDAGGDAPMAVFSDLAGRAFRGEGIGPDGEPIVDIARFEFILGGKALQSTHKLEGAAYGGRTVFFYDEGAKEYVYHYFTTAGFHTIGTLTPSKDGFTAIEAVRGLPHITEVRSSWVIDGDQITVKTVHIDDKGAPSPGDTIIYHAIDDPGPLFESHAK